MMETKRSLKTSIFVRAIRRRIRKEGTVYSRRRENLKPYNSVTSGLYGIGQEEIIM
jgi:hypothetical protein